MHGTANLFSVTQKMCPQRRGLRWEQAVVPLTGIRHGDSAGHSGLVWGGIYKAWLRQPKAVVPVYQKHTVTSFLNLFSEADGEMAFLGRVVGWGAGSISIAPGLSVQLEGGDKGGRVGM